MGKASLDKVMAEDDTLDPASPAAFWARVVDLLGPRTFRDLEAGTGVKYHKLYAANERGSDPSAGDARKIAEFFGVSIVWLVTGAGPMRDELTAEAREFWERMQGLPAGEQQAIRLLVMRQPPQKDGDRSEEPPDAPAD